jgi:hypothetical protein
MRIPVDRFVGLAMDVPVWDVPVWDVPVWDVTVFTKNRDRLLEATLHAASWLRSLPIRWSSRCDRPSNSRWTAR